MKRAFKSLIALALYACAALAVASPSTVEHSFPRLKSKAAVTPHSSIADVVAIDQASVCESKLSLIPKEPEQLARVASDNRSLSNDVNSQFQSVGSYADRGAKVRRICS